MKKKKGFTLIELLAVIVVLSVILVIAVPKILDIIEQAEKKAYKESVELMAHTAQIQYNTNEVTGTSEVIPEEGIVYEFENGEYKSEKTLNFKGDKPYSGTITLTKNKKVIIEKLVSKNKKWCAIKEEGEKSARVGRSTDPDFACIIEEDAPVPDKEPCDLEVGKTWNFDYTGNEQNFTTPCTGNYKLETWGAQGGGFSNISGGYGGYSVGEISLKKGEKIYINVGGQGKVATSSGDLSGGYNGGGSGRYNARYNIIISSGGGATHIAKSSGLLSSLSDNKEDVLIVSGGGGGTVSYYSIMKPGSGGGFRGGYSWYNNWDNSITYKSRVITSDQQELEKQTIEPSDNSSINMTVGEFGKSLSESGGGGGFYGASYLGGLDRIYSGGGGSGYIGNLNLKNKIMYCYDCDASSDEQTKTVSVANASSEAIENIPKEGNGYARIKYIGH